MLKFYIQLVVVFIVILHSFAWTVDAILIHPSEASQDLELNESSSVETCIAEFTARGGTFIRLDGDTIPFAFEFGDTVFPACSGGNNRSQTLWAILRQYDGMISLQLPHATRFGFDSYNGEVNWNKVVHHVKEDDEFALWAGFPKSKKLGFDEFKKWLYRNEASIDELEMMKAFYDIHYYNPDSAKGTRRVYITFAKNAHIHLYRLIQTNSSLENVFVLLYPLEDIIANPLPEWQIPPRNQKLYSMLSSMIEKYLDFTNLKPCNIR